MGRRIDGVIDVGRTQMYTYIKLIDVDLKRKRFNFQERPRNLKQRRSISNFYYCSTYC